MTLARHLTSSSLRHPCPQSKASSHHWQSRCRARTMHPHTSQQVDQAPGRPGCLTLLLRSKGCAWENPLSTFVRTPRGGSIRLTLGRQEPSESRTSPNPACSTPSQSPLCPLLGSRHPGFLCSRSLSPTLLGCRRPQRWFWCWVPGLPPHHTEPGPALSKGPGLCHQPRPQEHGLYHQPDPPRDTDVTCTTCGDRLPTC